MFPNKITKQKKCVICGKHLSKFGLYSFRQRLKNHIIYDKKPIIKFNTFNAKIKIRKDLHISKYPSISIYCRNCGQIYSNNRFNFRNISLRKRT